MKIKNIQNGIRLENETGFIDVTIENDRWITVHPNGEDEKGRHLLLEGDETPKEAMKRQWGVDLDKKNSSDNKEEAEAAEKTEEKAAATEQKPEEKKEGLSAYEVSKVKGGMYASAKETTIYRNGMLTARVEEFGEGNYRVDFYDGKKLQKINTYSTKSGMEKAVSKHLEGTEEKQLEKTNLEEKRKVYQEVLKRYNENDEKRWHSSGEDYYKAYEEAEKAKKELTKARREYAESIMANFEEVEENPYEEHQQARKERYEELSEKAQQRSDEISQSATRKFEAIPFGQPIHGASDRNYREKAWAQFGRSVEEGKKADYYAQKAESVGKAGISSDDANAIAKLAQKYKSVSDSAERRRIIDRVIDIDKRTRAIKQAQDSGSAEDYSDLGFDVERNTGINRLQLKFSGIPSGEIRTKLKSYGFRWSPRESAWQRQLTGNAEYSFKRLVEELRKK